MDNRKLATLIPSLLIRLYQWAGSGSPRRCRFFPTCSQYTLEALEAKGFWIGMGRGVLRILKCHPWHPGGYNPVDVIPR